MRAGCALFLCVMGCAARAVAPVVPVASPPNAAPLVASLVEAPAPPPEEVGDVLTRSFREAVCADPTQPSHPLLPAWCEYTRAIEIDAARPDAWYNLGVLYFQLGDIPALECAGTLLRGFLERAGDDPRLSVQVTNARQVLQTGSGPLPALRAMASLPGAPPTTLDAAPHPVDPPLHTTPAQPPRRLTLSACPR